MSTAAIIALVVLALIAVVAWFAFSRMSSRKRHEREIERRNRAIEERREQVVEEERSIAAERASRAQRAEQEARMERAAAEQHQARAELHREGHLDHEIERDIDHDGVADSSETQHADLRSERDAQAGTDPEFDEGRRFERDRVTEGETEATTQRRI